MGGHVARKNNENKKREGLTQRSGVREGGGKSWKAVMGAGEKEKEQTMSKEIKKFGYHTLCLPSEYTERPSILESFPK